MAPTPSRVVALLALLLGGPAAARADDAAADAAVDAAAVDQAAVDDAAVDAEGYRVGPRDVLRVVVFQEEDLTGEYTVGESGRVDFPLVGQLPVEGRTVEQVDALLTERLAADFLVDPQVQVQVASYGSMPVRVLGAVKKPGVYPLTGPTSVLELVALAGGMSTDGISEVRITRRGQDAPIVLRLDQATGDESAWTLEQGDTVFVPPPKVVYVAGEVSKPGAVAFSEDLTLSQAVILAGGATSTARLKKVLVKRGDEQIVVNLKRVLAGRDDDLVLQPDDTVLLSESAF